MSKSKSGIHKVPTNEEARKAFERVIAWRGEPEPCSVDGYGDFLFVNKSGKPYLAGHYQTVYTRCLPNSCRQSPCIYCVTPSAPGLQAKKFIGVQIMGRAAILPLIYYF